MELLQQLKKNLKWILLVLIILILSNSLTSIKVNSLSKKDKKAVQVKLDSLSKLYKEKEALHEIYTLERRKIFLEDSALLVKYEKNILLDKELIVKQRQALSKFTNLNSKINLSKLDSAYEAEN